MGIRPHRFSQLSDAHPTTLGGSEECAQLRDPRWTGFANGLRITLWLMDRSPAPFVAKLLAKVWGAMVNDGTTTISCCRGF